MAESQADIDALLAEAESLAAAALDGGSNAATAVLESPQESSPEPATASRSPHSPRPAEPRKNEIERILKIEVPVIVRLAQCEMPMSRILGLTPGAIVEFDKPSDAELDLMINNKCIGQGQAVKVGENFGLRITRIGNIKEKIRALGSGTA